MKRGILACTGVLMLLGSVQMSSFAAEQGAKSSLPTAAVRTLRENAQAVQQNASIYQWMRVNRETDRILAAGLKVEKALETEGTRKEQAEALKQAMDTLRSGRLNHDRDRITMAARKLQDIAESLSGQTQPK